MIKDTDCSLTITFQLNKRWRRATINVCESEFLLLFFLFHQGKEKKVVFCFPDFFSTEKGMFHG